MSYLKRRGIVKIISKNLEYNTKGNLDLIDITDDLGRIIEDTNVQNGTVTVFVVGSTAAVTTFEYEPGMIRDMNDLYEKVAPVKKHYSHDDTWGDANGFSHIRAALQGPSLVIPLIEGKLTLGTWQQVVLAEFDNQPRNRNIVIQIMGE